MAQEIEKLFVYTTMADGIEKIAIGEDDIPFIYLSMDALKESNIQENMQKWANAAGIVVSLKVFIPLTVLDVVEPMKTDLTM